MRNFRDIYSPDTRVRVTDHQQHLRRSAATILQFHDRDNTVTVQLDRPDFPEPIRIPIDQLLIES